MAMQGSYSSLKIHPVRIVSLSLELEMCVVATRVMKKKYEYLYSFSILKNRALSKKM